MSARPEPFRKLDTVGNTPKDDTGKQNAGDIPGLPNPRRFVAIGAISLGTALIVIDGAIANVALPTIADDLQVSNGAATNVVTVYQLVMVMLILPFGNFGDWLGHRRSYQLGQAMFVASSLLTPFVAHNFALLLILRALQAVGAAMALAVSTAILREIYPSRMLGAGLGIQSVVVSSSSALAPTLGGYIIDHISWQWIFFAPAPLAILSLALGSSLPVPLRHVAKLNLGSGLLSAAAIGSFIGGVQIASHSDQNMLGGGAIVLGIVLSVVLVRRESGQVRPVFPVDLFLSPVFSLSAMASILAFTATGNVLIVLPFQLHTELGYSAAKIGLLLLAFPLTMLVLSPMAGYFSDRVAPTKLAVIGMVLSTAGFVALGLRPDVPNDFDFIWRLALCAAGFALFFSPNSRLIIKNVPRERTAAAGGIISTCRFFGQALGATIAGLLLVTDYSTTGLPIYIGCVFTVLVAICSLVRFHTAREPQPSGG